MRVKVAVSTACYLIKDDKVLFIKFNKKWGQVYAPPGGKMDDFETPTECIIREFKEETNLDIKPIFKGISYWNWCDQEQGIIFFYTATEFSGNLKENAEEGRLSFIDMKDIDNLKQFDMNDKLKDYIFNKGIFEGKFLLNEDDSVKEFKVRKL